MNWKSKVSECVNTAVKPYPLKENVPTVVPHRSALELIYLDYVMIALDMVQVESSYSLMYSDISCSFACIISRTGP
jgi:hypothetical protein